MVEFEQPTRNILAIAKDLGVPPASFNHITDTKLLGHFEHASHLYLCSVVQRANLDADQWP